MATKLFKHQGEALYFSENKHAYALLMEQGTGKTATVIFDIARRYDAGDLQAVMVYAPNGVHTNWALREVPIHMPEHIEYRIAAYYSSPNKIEREAMENLFSDPGHRCLRIFAFNWESLITENGMEAMRLFMEKFRFPMMIGDESQRIKNNSAKRTKNIMALKKRSSDRIIMSGTAILNSPWDAFSQFGFLDEKILQITSYTAFKAEYAELLPANHGLLRHIMERTNGRYTPQVVARDIMGNPKWRNLDKLELLIAPHSFRVLKKDCLDLPEKVYSQIFFRLTPAQQKQYNTLKNDLRLQIEDGRIATMARIGALTKLSQIVSGYFLVPGTADTVQRIMPFDKNPKFQALIDLIEDCEGQIIIWARFRIELEDICEILRREKITFVEYHGDVKRAERPQAIKDFESGVARVFVGQQAAGGTGITLIAPNSAASTITVIYFSNTFALEDRLQSEDRAHRIGQEKTVVYIDIIAEKTIDERIVSSLKSKVNLAQHVLGDKRRALELLE